ncbi:MAG TPA: hypothetical protein VFT29_09200, partial [Gemmatimonadaceae bacterium]|nr:hypothetical protein [Gemmatimonadaceae bacterium]
TSVPPPEMDSGAYARMTPVERRGAWTRRGIELANQALRAGANAEEALALRGEARVRLLEDGAADRDTLASLAELDLRRALEIRPDLAAAWMYLAQLLRQQGRFADAADAAGRAIEADAYYEVRPVMAIGFMTSLHAGRFDDARRWCRMGLEHYAGDPRFTECELTSLGWTARSRDAVLRARSLMQTIERRDTLHLLSPTWKYRRLMVAAIMARAGMRDSAQAVLSEIESHEQANASARGNYMTEAYVRLLLGQRDAAIDRLSTYLRSTPQARPQVAKHPWFGELADDARFQALVRPAK